MKETLRKLCPDLTEEQLQQFQTYCDMLLDWNTRVNLTAIREPTAVAEKHFADSLSALALIPEGARLIDVGTGAGFPGIPLAIARPDISLTLLDGLQKRIRFLDAVCEALGLTAKTVHMRAEDAGRDPAYRGRFDIATTRAVAGLPVLIELTVPLLKVGGRSIAYKGDAGEELMESKGALHLLHASAALTPVDCPWGKRTLAVITKEQSTPAAYPRRAGTPEKKPL